MKFGIAITHILFLSQKVLGSIPNVNTRLWDGMYEELRENKIKEEK